MQHHVIHARRSTNLGLKEVLRRKVRRQKSSSKKSARMCRRPGRGTWPWKPESQIEKGKSKAAKGLMLSSGTSKSSKTMFDTHRCHTHVSTTHVEPNVFLYFFCFPTSPRCWKLPSPATRPRSKHVKACQSIRVPGFTSFHICIHRCHRLSWVPGYLNVSFPLSAVLAAHIATSCSTLKRSTELLNPMIQNFQLCEKARLHGLHACCELCVLQVLLIWTCKCCIPTNLEHRIALSLSHLAHHRCLGGALLHPPGRQNPP